MKKVTSLFVVFLFAMATIAQDYTANQPQFPRGNTSGLSLDHFPPIPEITVDQRLDVGNIIVKEKKKLIQYENLRQQLESSLNSPKTSEKKKTKNKEKIAEIDQKTLEIIAKTNKKISEKLTPEQYEVFLVKRGEFVVTASKGPTIENIQQQLQMKNIQ